MTFIDQYILLILYPSIVFFPVGYITKKKNIKKSITYAIQSVVCFTFSIVYYLFIPHGEAVGLSLVLGLFGILLLILLEKKKSILRKKKKKREEEKHKQNNK